MTEDEMELAERCHTDSCDHIAALRPAFWAACAAVGHRWTIVDVEPFCDRCGFREGDDADDDALANLPAPRPPEPSTDPVASQLVDRTAALEAILEHWDAMAGRNAHHLGCECGGSNDGVHSCRSLIEAIRNARALATTPEPAPVADENEAGNFMFTPPTHLAP